ncbi:uncharacterized protein MYCGRDRAFT_104253 [Zymoseptoria tritici IPO323]|uniref:Uncharacterized protein n=1 Tax=Zymoseptoria tritici (strain CBS 115943 / IPO323) TaxID=336722 RepID=F9X9R6_ZYMTI|nr:uncharacterized protein MYCGRDRAFT_104253 [Zymoseptoria tritici IPO323]EGP88056.1 hypothetical protein MYCGRDRAFT_104253 [Zymoseptoria tritici IPO323]
MRRALSHASSDFVGFAALSGLMPGIHHWRTSYRSTGVRMENVNGKHEISQLQAQQYIFLETTSRSAPRTVRAKIEAAGCVKCWDIRDDSLLHLF